jgi:hypothetical protein
VDISSLNKKKIRRKPLGIAPRNSPKEEGRQEREDNKKQRMKYLEEGNEAMCYYLIQSTYSMPSLCDFKM